MSTLLDFLTEEGPMLLTGATVLLALGALCVAAQKSPVKRQRTTELTMLVTLCWLALACVPLPRFSIPMSAAPYPAPDEVSPLADGLDSNPHLISELQPRPSSLPADEPLDWSASVPDDYEVDEAFELPADLLLPASEDFFVVEHPVVVPDAQVIAETPLEDELAIVERPTRSADALPAVSATTAAVPAPSGDTTTASSQTLATLFITGAGACCLWLAFGHLLLIRMVRRAQPPDDWLSDIYAQLSFEQAKPTLWTSARCRSAFSCGVWRPVIVLPANICHRNRTEQLRHILLHELAHVARRDAWDRWLFNIAFPLLYFHPVYWWLRNTAEMEAELIADDMAAGDSSRESYAEQLVALAREQSRALVPGIGALQILGSQTRFYRRMNMLVRRQERLATSSTLGWRLASVVLFGIALAVGTSLLGVDALSAHSGEDRGEESSAASEEHEGDGEHHEHDGHEHADHEHANHEHADHDHDGDEHHPHGDRDGHDHDGDRDHDEHGHHEHGDHDVDGHHEHGDHDHDGDHDHAHEHAADSGSPRVAQRSRRRAEQPGAKFIRDIEALTLESSKLLKQKRFDEAQAVMQKLEDLIERGVSELSTIATRSTKMIPQATDDNHRARALEVKAQQLNERLASQRAGRAERQRAESHRKEMERALRSTKDEAERTQLMVEYLQKEIDAKGQRFSQLLLDKHLDQATAAMADIEELVARLDEQLKLLDRSAATIQRQQAAGLVPRIRAQADAQKAKRELRVRADADAKEVQEELRKAEGELRIRIDAEAKQTEAQVQAAKRELRIRADAEAKKVKDELQRAEGELQIRADAEAKRVENEVHRAEGELRIRAEAEAKRTALQALRAKKEIQSRAEAQRAVAEAQLQQAQQAQQRAGARKKSGLAQQIGAVESMRRELKRKTQELADQLEANNTTQAAAQLAEIRKLMERLDDNWNTLAKDATATTARPSPTPVPSRKKFRPGAIPMEQTEPRVKPVATQPSEPARPRQPVELPQVPRTPRTSPSAVGIDLVQLADAYSDAMEKHEIAELELGRLAKLSDENVVGKKELRLADIQFRSAQRKLNVVRKIVESSMMAAEANIASAEAEMEYTQKIFKKGYTSEAALASSRSRIEQARSRLVILKIILDY